MNEFLCAIEEHPKACAFLVLLAILTCTFRLHWFIGKNSPDNADNQQDKK